MHANSSTAAKSSRPKKIISWWKSAVRRWSSMIIGLLAAATLVCGLIGFYLLQCEDFKQQNTNHPWDWTRPLYLTAQLFLLNSGAESDIGKQAHWFMVGARLSASLLFLFVSGTVIAQYLRDLRKLPRQLRQSGHYVICGMGQVGLHLLNDLNARGKAAHVVVIEFKPDNLWIEHARNLGATVIVGDATDSETLREARAEYAAEIFIVAGDDGLNLEVAAEIGELLSDKNIKRVEAPIDLYIHVLDSNLANTVRPYGGMLGELEHLNVHVFNVPRAAVTRLITDQLWAHAPHQADEVAHYFIVGFGPMGQTVVTQLAQLAQFPNLKRSRFTIADGDIERKAKQFVARYSRFTSWEENTWPGVNDFTLQQDQWTHNSNALPVAIKFTPPDEGIIQYVCNARFQELPGGIAGECFAAQVKSQIDPKTNNGTKVKPVVIVCGQNDRDNFDTAANLRSYFNSLELPEIPIFTWLSKQPALAHLVRSTPEGYERYRFLAFGGCQDSANYAEVTRPLRDIFGQKFHENYERKTIAKGDSTKSTPWDKLRDELRESNRVAADHMLIKLAVLGYRLRRPEDATTLPPPLIPIEMDAETRETLGHMEHNRWVAERLMGGWRYAPEGNTPEEKDANKRRKLNHNLVIWEKLDEKRKDFEQLDTILRECQSDGFWLEKIEPLPPTA